MFLDLTSEEIAFRHLLFFFGCQADFCNRSTQSFKFDLTHAAASATTYALRSAVIAINGDAVRFQTEVLKLVHASPGVALSLMNIAETLDLRLAVLTVRLSSYGTAVRGRYYSGGRMNKGIMSSYVAFSRRAAT